MMENMMEKMTSITLSLLFIRLLKKTKPGRTAG